MEGFFRGAFDTILELPQMLRDLLGQSSVRDYSMLEDGLLADGSSGIFPWDPQARSRKRPRLDISAVDWEDQHGDCEARKPAQTRPHGHCQNCGVRIGSQEFTMGGNGQTDPETSDVITTTQSQNPRPNDERVPNHRSPQPSLSSETGDIVMFPPPSEQESHDLPLEQTQELYEPYAEDAHIVLHSDGISHQLAILLTKDMASQIREIGKESRALDQHETLLATYGHEVLSAKAQVSYNEFLLESAKDDTERARLRQQADQYHEAVRTAEQRRSRLDQDISMLRINENCGRDRLQHQLEKMLADSGLLDLSTLEPEAIDSQAQDPQANLEQEGSVRSESLRPATDPEELLRCAAQEELEEAFEAFYKADNNFDFWPQHYWNEEEEYNRMIATENFILSRTDFDLSMYEEKQDFTRALIDAEERKEKAIANAKALGLDVSLYYDHELAPEDQWKDDGYRESLEASLVNNVDRGIIDRWLEGLSAESPDSPNVEPSEHSDGLKCDAVSIGLSSCDSVVAGYSGEYGWLFRDRIASWKEHCSLLREERLAGS